jgi:hypothetical protein
MQLDITKNQRRIMEKFKEKMAYAKQNKDEIFD